MVLDALREISRGIQTVKAGGGGPGRARRRILKRLLQWRAVATRRRR